MRFVPATDQQLTFGIDATANESDSLENLAVLPGIKVRQIRNGSPADRAGLRAGDVILTIDGVATNDPDALATIATTEPSEKTLPLQARRGTTVFETQLPVPDSSEAIAPEERYRIDPTKTRASYRTELVHDINSDKQFTVARVVELQPESPLRVAGILPGDAIFTIEGRPVASAQELITLIHNQHDFGETIDVGILRAGDSRLDRFTTRVRLWDPGRRLSQFTIWPLFIYDSDLATQHTRFALFDFWLFSLFAYERNQGEKAYTLLGIFNIASDYGELVDETSSGE